MGEGTLYTLGIWETKVGKEAEFIETWQSFAEWTSQNQPGASIGKLLQNEETPQRFVSFGPWEDAESIAEWRNQPQFKEFAAKVRDLCVDFEPQNMILVAHSSRMDQ